MIRCWGDGCISSHHFARRGGRDCPQSCECLRLHRPLTHKGNLGALSHSKQPVWGHFTTGGVCTFPLMKLAEWCFRLNHWLFVDTLQDEIKHVEMQHWETELALDYIDGCGRTDVAQRATMSYFSETETPKWLIIGLFSLWSEVTLQTDQSCLGLFFSCCFSYLWVPVVPRSGHPYYDHSVGGSHLWDWQLTFHSSYEPYTNRKVRFRRNVRVF